MIKENKIKSNKELYEEHSIESGDYSTYRRWTSFPTYLKHKRFEMIETQNHNQSINLKSHHLWKLRKIDFEFIKMLQIFSEFIVL